MTVVAAAVAIAIIDTASVVTTVAFAAAVVGSATLVVVQYAGVLEEPLLACRRLSARRRMNLLLLLLPMPMPTPTPSLLLLLVLCLLLRILQPVQCRAQLLHMPMHRGT